MRLQILSDLHLEFGPADIADTESDVIVLAGDIHLGREGRKWMRKRFSGKPIIYVLGNHEFYRNALPELTETLKRETEGSNIHLLENAVAEIDGFKFLGCTLWSDFMSAPNPTAAVRLAEEIVSDYRIVWNSSEKRVLSARDTIKIHQASVVWLNEELGKAEPDRTIVVTHHAPSFRSEPDYHANSPIRDAFASNLDWLVDQSHVRLWIHGHTHFNVDYQIGSTRVLTNQRGYPDENCEGFNPDFVVEL